MKIAKDYTNKRKRLFYIFDMNYKIYLFIIILSILLVITLPVFVYNQKLNIIIIIISSFILIPIVTLYYNLYSFFKVVRNISELEVESIEDDLISPVFNLEHNFILTNKYLIKQIYCPAIINVSDIILIYKKITIPNKRRRYDLIIHTKDNKKYKMPLFNYYYFINASSNYSTLEYYLKKLNNNILFGYNSENINKIKNKYGIIIKK